jgi:hypothetical protein
MAIVNIPFGGQSVPVTVPDFAMEATQQDVLIQSQKQTDALQQIASKMGISLSNDQNEIKSNKQLTSQIQKNAKQQENQNRRLELSLDTLGRGASNTVNAMQQAGDTGKLSDMIGKQGLLGNMGFAAMGAQLGTLFGIMEEFGDALGALRRTGAGLGADLVELRGAAAAVGLDMQTLSKLTVENGAAIRSLGENSKQGTNEFLRLNHSLREASRDMGFFGMGTKEMSALLVDEIELRRATRNEAFLEEGARSGMIDSIKENMKLNEVMAGLTGQDVQDRIKARNEFRKDAVNAAAMSRMNEGQLESLKSLTEGMSQMGTTAQPLMMQAVKNLMAGVPIDKFNEGFTQLAAAAGAEGINLRGSIEDMAAMVQAGANPTEIAAAADALAGQFKNIQVDDGILARAAAGQEGAIALLTARMEVFASNADSQAESSTLVNDNLEKLNSSLARGEAVLSGIANQLTVTSQKIKDNLLDGYLKAFDINPNDPNKFANFINQLERLPDSEKFQTFMNGLIEFTTALSGAQGVLSLLDVDGSGKLERGLNIGLLVAAIAKQLGVTGVAAGAIPGLRKGGATGPDQARRQMDPSTLNGIGLNALFATGGALAATVAMKTTDGKEIGPENPMPVTIMKVENGAFSQVTIKTSTTSSN